MPAYPEGAKRTGAAGTTELAFTIDENGKVGDVTVVRSSGPTREHRALDRAARQSLESCVFPPPAEEAARARKLGVRYVWSSR